MRIFKRLYHLRLPEHAKFNNLKLKRVFATSKRLLIVQIIKGRVYDGVFSVDFDN